MPVSRYGTDSAQCAAIRHVLETVAEAPARQWTVDDLAWVAKFSKFHFTRIFQRHVGVSPHRYLMRYRCELAKEMLERTPAYVSTIAKGLGFTSIGTFSSRFKKDVGCSPLHYREYAAYAEKLTADAGGTVRLDRDAAGLGLTLDPRDLPQFRLSMLELERQLGRYADAP